MPQTDIRGRSVDVRTPHGRVHALREGVVPACETGAET